MCLENESIKNISDGYSICFNEWALDSNIKGEIGLLLIISSLSASSGCCFASNEYLARLFCITEVSVSRKIKKLERLGYIKVDYKKRGCEIISRHIRLTKMLTDDYQKRQSTINKNVKDNNISVNNKENIFTDVNIQKKKAKRFSPPSPEELYNYLVTEENLRQERAALLADKFINFYGSKDWYVGKNKMKSWKMAISGWITREKEVAFKKQEQDDDGKGFGSFLRKREAERENAVIEHEIPGFIKMIS